MVLTVIKHVPLKTIRKNFVPCLLEKYKLRYMWNTSVLYLTDKKRLIVTNSVVRV